MDALRPSDSLHNTHLVLAECTTVIRREVFFRRIRHEQALNLMDRLLNVPLQFSSDPQTYRRALELARRFQHKKAYDMQYLALAETVGAELVTMDRGLRHAATQVGVPVRFLQ